VGNSFNVIEGMQPVPFTRSTVIQLVLVTLLPVARLLLTTFSLQILERLLEVVF
jgi:hypothetical protein